MRILLLFTLSLIGLAGCNQTAGNSYPTGYNTPAAGATLLNKSINIGGLTGCTDQTSSLTCLAVYTNGSAGDGLTVSDGTTKLKIYKTTAASSYTVQKITVATNAITCNETNVGTLSVISNGDGTSTVSLVGAAWNTACTSTLAVGQSAKAVVY